MSTSLLYHGFSVVGYQQVSQHFDDGRVTFCIDQARERYRCSQCKSADVIAQGHGELRFFRTVSIGSKQVFLSFRVPRVICFNCGAARQVKVGFADPKKHYTRAFERHALELSKLMTILDVAKHLHVSWDVVKDIQKRHLQTKFGKPKLKNLREIAIDEIAIGKGHSYLTTVLDLRTGAVVFVGDGKNASALDPFWRMVRRARAKIRAVATDMSKAYIKAVRENLPKAVHVFDRFHVVKLLNDKLSAFRRELHRQTVGEDERRVLKGTRWLLLKNPENLDEKKDEFRRLREALELNIPLATAYYLKDDLRQIWEQPDKATARRVLRDWIARARASEIGMLVSFAATLETHSDGILAWYDYPISTGPLEGTNTKIQAMKRQAYGFRDREFYKLKILGIHETKHALVG